MLQLWTIKVRFFSVRILQAAFRWEVAGLRIFLFRPSLSQCAQRWDQHDVLVQASQHDPESRAQSSSRLSSDRDIYWIAGQRRPRCEHESGEAQSLPSPPLSIALRFSLSLLSGARTSDRKCSRWLAKFAPWAIPGLQASRLPDYHDHVRDSRNWPRSSSPLVQHCHPFFH